MNPGCWRCPSFLSLDFFEMDKGKKDKILFKEHKNYLGFLLILSYKAIFI